ncbi:ATP-binding protein [Alkalibacillus silvisoli]|uniref:Histidine kinase/HSP90-like ATPase domain-containing protein n=1 Tax=Alkalibacillus silvisoli TaxID=392823 RepID=A0ABN0ZZ20_9BACI
MSEDYAFIINTPTEFRSIRKTIHEKLFECFSGDQMLVDLSLFEMTTNAWKHGNKMNPSKKIHIKILFLKESMLVRVKDEGKGFQVPDSLKTCYESCRDSVVHLEQGRGIQLTTQIMDQLVYSKEGNDLLLRKWYTSHNFEGVEIDEF